VFEGEKISLDAHNTVQVSLKHFLPHFRTGNVVLGLRKLSEVSQAARVSL
jgi:hypothetical protein